MIENIYINIPFCYDICKYCNFYKRDLFIYKDYFSQKGLSHYIIKEIQLYQKKIKKDIRSIYIGGGTPLIIGVAEIEKIMNYLYSNFNLENCEITLEVNPNMNNTTPPRKSIS